MHEIPGFAGHYLDAGGNSIVLLVGTVGASRAEAYVQSIRAKSGLPRRPVAVRSATYDFAQLQSWRQPLRDLLARRDVRSLDIDETSNRIAVGVANQETIGQVSELIIASGVPAPAFAVAVEPPAELRQNLNSVARPTLAGYEVDNESDFIGYCTLGFNATLSGTAGNFFVTASHCSNLMFYTDGSGMRYRQPTDGSLVAWEYWDPILRYNQTISFNGQSFNCNLGSATGCRFSDTALNAYYDSIPAQVGYIAKPAFYSIGGRGSKEVVGSWNIVGKLPMTVMVVGKWTSKVGATSGWTRGQIDRTCFDFNDITPDGRGYRLFCQYRAGLWSEGGDSGSPVFLDYEGEPAVDVTSVTLYGIMWGGPTADPTRTYFSTIEGIEFDFGTTFKLCDANNSC